MQYKTNKTLSILSIVSFLFLPFFAYGHGFAPDTLVQLGNGSWQTIHTICSRSLHDKIPVASYNLSADYNTNQWVTSGRQSQSNCYIRLGFDPEFNDASHNDITCTPMQEFYIPATHQWTAAYNLKIGDALFTKNMVAKPITYIQFVPEPLTIYTLEIEKSHTFFVGKHSILTHNIFLPMAFNIGLSLPFGSVAAGTAGSFFGPIGVACGVVLGGIIGLTIKAIYEDRIPAYQTKPYNIAAIKALYHNTTRYNEEFNSSTKPTGCFTPNNEINTIDTHITPIENPLPKTAIGCGTIEVDLIPKEITKGCGNTEELEKNNANRCFEPIPQNDQLLFNTQEKAPVTESKPGRYDGPKARNWKEFEKECPVGQLYGKKFINTGKQNPKDKAPIRQLSEDIPNTEMFKEGRLFALDKFHEGDHMEVWDKKGKWIGVANLDGSKNHQKSNAEINQDKRRLID